jgi:hypothetical protein
LRLPDAQTVVDPAAEHSDPLPRLYIEWWRIRWMGRKQDDDRKENGHAETAPPLLALGHP